MPENRDVPEQYHIGETTGWSVNHRINSSLPGYLMISSKTFTNDLSDLPSEALCSLGLLFAKVQDALKRVLTGLHRPLRACAGVPHPFPCHPNIRVGWGAILEGWPIPATRNFRGRAGRDPYWRRGTDAIRLARVLRTSCSPADQGASVAEATELLRRTIQFS